MIFSIYEKLIQYCGIDELGTNYPKVSQVYKVPFFFVLLLEVV